MGRKQTIAGVGPVAVGALVGVGINFIYHGVAGRVLENGQYATVAATITFVTLIGVVFTAVERAVSANAAELNRNYISKTVLRWLTPVVLVAVVTGFVLGRPVEGVWVGVMAAVMSLGAGMRGSLLGQNRTQVVAGTYFLAGGVRGSVGIVLLIWFVWCPCRAAGR